MFKLYQFLTHITGPFIDLYLKIRLKKGKEDPERIKERLGHPAIPRPKGPLIWIHAASIGESLSVLPLINAITKQEKSCKILLTTGTVSSAKIIEKRLPDNAFHQYIPIDKTAPIKRFLAHWQPNLALWVESELWPNTITETQKHCAMILINGRMSNESYKKWQNYKSLGKHMLSKFSLVLAQSTEDAERFRKIGANSVKHLGNLKFDTPALPADPEKTGKLITEIGERHIWLAASTHNGEEEIIAHTHQRLKEDYPDLLTIIAPRHPGRSPEILETLQALPLKVVTRSHNQKIHTDTDIYLADTLGEMGILYRLVTIAFIGGSLVSHGGQNPLEAARLECAILFGPHMENFQAIKKELEQNHAALKVKDGDELYTTLKELLKNHEKQEKLTKQVTIVLEKKQNILNSYLNELSPYFKKIS